MTDIVERLRLPEVFIDTGGMNSRVAHEAAAELEWLRGERNRLAADLAKAHKDAVAWMEKVHQPAAEIARLREALQTAADALQEAGCSYAWAAAHAALLEGRRDA